MPRLGTLHSDISPPPLRRTALQRQEETAEVEKLGQPSLAAIEAGRVEITDHLNYFTQRLTPVSRATDGPRICFADWRSLWTRNHHQRGHHFVIHQHDHPIAGVHYDLRLQFSGSSTISFAIPYGLPGNPNSTRPNRMAIETRVHNLWNNLIESASHASGSLLIWDTGEYEVLPRTTKQERMTDDELSDVENLGAEDCLSESEKLNTAFRTRYIRLRLHGVRLPRNYTIILRLPSANEKSAQPNRPKRKRRRTEPYKVPTAAQELVGSDFEDANFAPPSQSSDAESEADELAAGLASEDEEDTTIRTNNAYTGAINDIGSIHQRHWLITLDRSSSGFRKARSGEDAGRWVGNWKTFYVLGRDHERSVVTGRNSDDALGGAKVGRFIGRKMWRPVME